MRSSRPSSFFARAPVALRRLMERLRREGAAKMPARGASPAELLICEGCGRLHGARARYCCDCGALLVSVLAPRAVHLPAEPPGVPVPRPRPVLRLVPPAAPQQEAGPDVAHPPVPPARVWSMPMAFAGGVFAAIMVGGLSALIHRQDGAAPASARAAPASARAAPAASVPTQEAPAATAIPARVAPSEDEAPKPRPAAAAPGAGAPDAAETRKAPARRQGAERRFARVSAQCGGRTGLALAQCRQCSGRGWWEGLLCEERLRHRHCDGRWGRVSECPQPERPQLY